MEKVLQEFFWVHFFGCPYRSNGTKLHLDAALNTSASELNEDLEGIGNWAFQWRMNFKPHPTRRFI